jgi:hypothetical protein
METLPEKYQQYINGIKTVSDARLERNARMLSTSVNNVPHAQVLLEATQAELEHRKSQQ